MEPGREMAARLMTEFSERTRLGEPKGSKRYLWTDAFALVNALDLWCSTGDEHWKRLATTLISDVHRVLGRHRPDDPRTGWLSGLPEQEGSKHPTRGGLRIGKPLPERLTSHPHDERLEWDRDGQYWHYLTKWMDALLRASVVLGEPAYHRYAAELAEATFLRFLRADGNGLIWKMSIDLSRPLVAGLSSHDALDGYVTFRWLGRGEWQGALSAEAAILRRLVEDEDWATGDPLGLGGLMLDALRLALLPERTNDDERLIAAILAGVDAGLAHVLRGSALERPAAGRLGFRELGLAIGLQAVPLGREGADTFAELARIGAPHLQRIAERTDIDDWIVAFWADAGNRQASTWTEHRDINEVMLSTALLRAHAATGDIAKHLLAAPEHSSP